MKDLYTILGVQKTATADEIKTAYRKLAMKYHPDKNPGDKAAEEHFKKISAAYDVLGDETKRRQYDSYGDTFDNRSATSNRSYNYGTWQKWNQGTWGQETQDDYDPFSQWFSYTNSHSHSSSNGTGTYTFYTRTREPATKAESFFTFVKGIFFSLFGLFFITRLWWFFFPVSTIVGISLVAAGIGNIKRAVQGMLK